MSYPLPKPRCKSGEHHVPSSYWSFGTMERQAIFSLQVIGRTGNVSRGGRVVHNAFHDTKALAGVLEVRNNGLRITDGIGFMLVDRRVQ